MKIPSTWPDVLERLRPKRTVAVVGATDTGKSTFCRWLVHTLAEESPTGLVDADVGQTTFGPPTTVGGKVFRNSAPVKDDLRPSALAFVGSTSPQGHLLQTVLAAQQVCDRLRCDHAHRVVVDTTGLVAGGLGRALKLHKLAAIAADAVVLLDRTRELDGLAWTLACTGREVLRLPVSAAVRTRSPQERRGRREAAFRTYFSDAEPREFDLRTVRVRDLPLGRGRVVAEALGHGVAHAELCPGVLVLVLDGSVPQSSVCEAKSRLGAAEAACVTAHLLIRALVGLCSAGRCLGVGVVERADPAAQRWAVRTPVRAEVDSIVIGSMRLAGDFSEAAGDPRPVYV